MIRREEVYKIGRLGKTHGVRGEISFLLDDDVFDRTDADYLILDIDGILVPFFIEEYRFKTDSNALMKFDGIDTQERARELTGCDVYFPRSLADEDEMNVSWAELVGYDLIDSNSGKAIGEIAAIDDSTMTDLLTTFGLSAPDDNAEPTDKQREAPVDEIYSNETEDAATPEDEGIKITGIILDKVTRPRMDGTRGSALYRVPFRLSERPTSEWKQLFLRAWDLPPRFSTMHRPGIASVVGDTIVLDGTTIDEVADYHRDTLVLCVEQANQEYRKLCERREADERRRREQEERHQSHLADVAQRIRF